LTQENQVPCSSKWRLWSEQPLQLSRLGSGSGPGDNGSVQTRQWQRSLQGLRAAASGRHQVQMLERLPRPGS
jgi:hypothetical protein